MNNVIVAENYASMGRRFVAFFLDGMILFFIGMIVNLIAPIVGGIVVFLFYSPVFEASPLMATPGKHLMGIQATDLEGLRLSFKSSLIRNLLKCVSSLFLFLGFVVALFTQRKQTFHDMLASSVVVYGRSEGDVFDTWWTTTKEIFNQLAGKSATSVSELERLHALREKGALTDEEFQLAKKRLLT
jgi:uncharacterized RDD family membrane protein YckC